METLIKFASLCLFTCCLAFSISAQEKSENPVLPAYRTFLHWRKTQPCLQYGDIEFIESNDEQLIFTRCYQHKNIMVIANFTSQEIKYQPLVKEFEVMSGHGFKAANISNDKTVVVAPFQIAFLTF